MYLDTTNDTDDDDDDDNDGDVTDTDADGQNSNPHEKGGLKLPDHLNLLKVVKEDNNNNNNNFNNRNTTTTQSWSSPSSTSFLRIHSVTTHPTPMQLLQHACRVPLVHAFRLRQTILSHRVDRTRFVDNSKVWLHPCNEELRLCSFVDDFVKAHGTLEIYMTSPLPFPLVQMTKTLVFVWLFTLPLVFHVTETSQLVVSVGMVVLITYGFAGLEFVSMEMSDCFGEDASDLDIRGHAEQCYEDCYMAVYKVDGKRRAQRLRTTVARRSLFRDDDDGGGKKKKEQNNSQERVTDPAAAFAAAAATVV